MVDHWHKIFLLVVLASTHTLLHPRPHIAVLPDRGRKPSLSASPALLRPLVLLGRPIRLCARAAALGARIVTFELETGILGSTLPLSYVELASDNGGPEPGRGGGGIVVGRSRGSDGGGIADVLTPNEDRFEYGLGAIGPVDRLNPPAEE